MSHLSKDQPQDKLLKGRLVAASLLAISTCGTLALFGSVPVIARMLSAPGAPDSPRQAEQPQPPRWFSELLPGSNRS